MHLEHFQGNLDDQANIYKLEWFRSSSIPAQEVEDRSTMIRDFPRSKYNLRTLL